jgi:hypothetical protein
VLSCICSISSSDRMLIWQVDILPLRPVNARKVVKTFFSASSMRRPGGREMP